LKRKFDRDNKGTSLPDDINGNVQDKAKKLSSVGPGDPVLKMKGITIKFGDVVANNNVDFDLLKKTKV